ncbi:hypothetical protein [Streptomyces sp. NPDC058877]|uniref:hypothetical protein n=1 Tax=unclassified Streptomyces TaxID=2593676 RepID=UPI003680F827
MKIHQSTTTLVEAASPARKRLERLRRSLNSDTTGGGAGSRVVLYVKTLPGEDPEPHFQQLRAKAAGRKWAVRCTIHDDSGEIVPTQSAAWNELMKALAGGFARGVLAPTYRHISVDEAYYETALYGVHKHRCFTSLLVPEPST